MGRRARGHGHGRGERRAHPGEATRGAGASCRTFSPASKAFTGRNCATHKGFAATYAKGRWSIAFGKRLAAGDYGLEIAAISATGKVQPVTAGKNKIRFTVA